MKKIILHKPDAYRMMNQSSNSSNDDFSNKHSLPDISSINRRTDFSGLKEDNNIDFKLFNKQQANDDIRLLSNQNCKSATRQTVICPICSKNFNNSSALAKHKLTHSNERKYICSICSKAFKRQDHLNGHLLTHSSKKPFACKFTYCDKSYCDARSLKRHLENAHSKDVEKVVEARRIMNAAYSPITPTGPNSKAFWEGNVFDDVMTVECKVCKRRFKNIAALNGHMRLHGGYNMNVEEQIKNDEKSVDEYDILNDITNADVNDSNDKCSMEKDDDNDADCEEDEENDDDDDVFSFQNNHLMTPSLMPPFDKKRRTMSADPDKYTNPQKSYVTKDSILQLLKEAGMEEILNKVGLEVDMFGTDERLELPDHDLECNKLKTKRKPEPLVIPADLNASFGFTSALRSPKLDILDETLPPYTPPPILSPARKGSGLFWTIRRKCDEPPVTDVLPHINIGPTYQANIPKCQSNLTAVSLHKYKFLENSREESIWSLESGHSLCDSQLSNYEKIACSAAIPYNGNNKEYALHVLHAAKGDVKTAMMLLITGDIQQAEECVKRRINSDLPLHETEPWNRCEIEAFNSAMLAHDKDFVKVAKELNTKSVHQCVEFYYLWKKVCKEQYVMMKNLRRRRQQDEILTLRSEIENTKMHQRNFLNVEN